jgi:hypothetical protein
MQPMPPPYLATKIVSNTLNRDVFTSLAKISSPLFLNIPLQHLNYDANLAWMLVPLPTVGADFTLLAGKALEQSY